MDEDEETLCRFGTPLPTYEEDEIPAKKPVSVEDQIVLDVNGKRRFHGAFTGGFSAGYWNTVGSEEGWKPAEFKSSRKEKAASRSQNPMDFMDDEDLGEFGIAPQRVQTKEDFAHSSKATKRQLVQSNWSGPIPGTPVLKTLLEPAKERTAVRMLKNMGWREGQGIGERQSKVEKQKAKNRNDKELFVMKMYGCELPSGGIQNANEEDSDSQSDSSDYEVTFAPDDFDPLLAAIKDNTFGLGYSGLERGSVVAQRFNLFDTLEIVDRNNKKLSIRGQAFGVGALEDDDDEDVYAKDDMSRYDFSLEDKSKAPAAIKSSGYANCLEGFCPSKKVVKGMKKVFRVNLPGNFMPRNWLQRRTRFEPLDETKEKQFLESNRYRIQGLGRHDLDPEKRAQALGEKPLDKSKDTKNSILDIINKRKDSFVTSKVMNPDELSSSQADGQNQIEVKKDPLKFDILLATGNLGATKEGFKPFIADPEKQERYDKFVSFTPTDKLKSKEEFLNSLQPLGMSSWDREREFKEFSQAQRMYRPLDGLMSDRFVTESSLICEKETVDPTKLLDIKMKRDRSIWKPNKDLCKRFNVPEPFGGMLEEEKTKTKNKFSVFDYLEAPVHSKSNFVTPVVIPKRSTKDEKGTESVPVRVSAKDFFSGVDKPSTSHEKRSSTVIPKPHVQTIGAKKPENRTDLEQKVLESINMKPEEKKDLFKSIFCSSDEDEEADPKPSEAIRTDSASSMNETDKIKLVESLVAIKPASQMNVLRNNSPPRGIFKSILEIKRTEPDSGVRKITADSEDSSSSSEDDEFYGPKLPSQTANEVPTSSSSSLATQHQLDARLKAIIEKTGSHSIVEEWVEKDKTSSKKSKKKKLKEHKKSKKNKKAKKKHKHKDRR
ncbi:G patch domain-containing protein 1 homolog [Ochlerotatus camptorhynchus]|uniref:G patch domain-containing protein 1 homolog n=1 Tax=Ochlerotatus camptorhynchus TaxID=644619 RepID=UPI0031DB737B